MDNSDIKKAGLKVTLPRVKILEVLTHAEEHHLSAEDIYRRLTDSGEDVGLATVYRVLTQFESAGLVLRHNFEGDHAIFELKQTEHHDHLVCVKCACVVEFVDNIIEDRQLRIAQENNYKMTDHSLIIYGLCPRCQTHETDQTNTN